jgi:AAA family ATP:ADP antiporter
MFAFIFRLLNIRPREALMVILTSLQAICIGTFLASFDIGSHAIFLDTFQTDQIPMAFVISGLFGVIIMSLYTFFSSRVSFRLFTLFNYLIIGITTVIIFYYAEFHELIKLSAFGYPLMMPFTLMFPINTIILLNFWHSINNIYINDQNKRILPYIQLAHIGGMVLGSWGIILFLFKSWNLELIILGSAISIFIAFFLQFLINPIHKYSKLFLPRIRKLNPIRSRFGEFFYTKYTFLLVLFVVLSALIGMIVHYNFISLTRDSYPMIVGFAKFLGLFIGTLFIFIYGVNRFLIRKILYSYDSPYSLFLVPAGMIVLLAASVVAFLFLGHSRAVFRFTFFFLLIAGVKAGYETLKHTIELPSLRVLFQTLDIRFHRAVIQRLEGSFRFFSMFSAGLILIGLIQLNFHKSSQLVYVVIVLSLLWLYISVILIKKYQTALKNSIKKIKTNVKAKEHDLPSVDKHFHKLLNSDIPEKVINALEISEHTEPISFENHLIDLLSVPSPEIRRYILWKINSLSVFASLPKLKELKINDNDNSSANLRSNTVAVFEKKLFLGKSFSALEKLSNSKKISERILACEVLGSVRAKKEAAGLLINLSRDFEPEVKLAAIKSMTRMSNPEHTHILIGYLSSPVFYSYAFEALVRIGNKALNQLEQVFLTPDAENILLSRIVKIYGKIGSPKAIDLLLNKLEYQNRIIARQAIIALRESGFQATPNNINIILNAIVRILNIMSWNLSASSGIGLTKKFPLLQDALNAELADNYRVLFHLLSMAYNSTAIANIRNLVNTGSDRDISYAIEMLDQIVNEEIKQVLFPVLENISIISRVKQLKYFFPAENIPRSEIISEVITRDYNVISLYAKTCAIISWLRLKNQDIDQVLVSNLFHPNKLIRESAAYVINEIDSNYLDTVYPRIEPGIVNEIKTSLEHARNGSHYLIFNRIQFLRKCYKLLNTPEYVLLEFARYLELNKFDKEKEITVDLNEKTYSLLILIDGSIEVIAEGYDNIVFDKFSLLYTNAIANAVCGKILLKIRTYTEFYSLDKESLNMLIFDYSDIRKSVLDCIEEL